MTVLADFGDGSANLGAVQQQLLLVALVYARDLDSIRNYLGADASIVAHRWWDEAWPPSWVLIKQDDQVFIVLEGTTNWSQLVPHVVGLAGREVEGNGTYENFLWGEIAAAIEEEITLTGALEGIVHKFRISGHSFGAAVGFYLGRWWADTRNPNTVQGITFGEPKSLTSGYTGPDPKVWWRFVSNRDPVPSAPPPGAGPVWPGGIQEFPWPIRLMNWQHYHAQVNLSPYGTFNPSPIYLFPVDPYVATDPVGEHLLANYNRRLYLIGKAIGGTEEFFADNLQTSLILVGGRVPPREVPFSSSGTRWDLAERVYYESRLGIASQPGAVYVTGGPVATFLVGFHYASAAGAVWEENFWRDSGDAESATDFPAPVIAARRSMLSTAARLTSITATRVSGIHQSHRRPMNLPGTAAPPTNSLNPEFLDISASAVVWSLIGTLGAKRLWWIRGCPDYETYRTPLGFDTITARLKNAIDTFVALLPGNGVGIVRLIKSAKDGNAATDYRRITALEAVDNAKNTKVTVQGAHGITAPAQVLLGLLSKKRFPGMNGRYDVLAVTGVNSVVVGYTLPRVPAGNPAPGRMRAHVFRANDLIRPDLCGLSHNYHRDTKDAEGSRGAKRPKRLRGFVR